MEYAYISFDEHYTLGARQKFSEKFLNGISVIKSDCYQAIQQYNKQSPVNGYSSD